MLLKSAISLINETLIDSYVMFYSPFCAVQSVLFSESLSTVGFMLYISIVR